MTHLERYAVTIATCADRPKKEHKASKYLNNLEEVAREVAQPLPREIKHRDQLPVMRRLDASNADEIGGEIGAKILAGAMVNGAMAVPT